MKYITGDDRNQVVFLPDCIEDYVSKDNPVRVIDAFVNQLDMDDLELEQNQMIPVGHLTIRGICLNYTYTDISIEYGLAES